MCYYLIEDRSDIIKKIFLIICLFTMFLTMDTVLADNYTKYEIGDKVSIANLKYIVIEDSDTSKDNVLIVRQTPLTKDEFGNVETFVSIDHPDKLPFYSSETCSSDMNSSGCSEHNTYANSTIKQVLDTWANKLDEKLNNGLVPVSEIYGESDIVRILNINDINTIKESKSLSSNELVMTETLGIGNVKPCWIAPSNESTINYFDGTEFTEKSIYTTGYVFPVIRAHKGALDGDSNTSTSGIVIENSSNVGVENTLLGKSTVPLLIGIIFVSIGACLYLLVLKRKIKDNE